MAMSLQALKPARLQPTGEDLADDPSPLADPSSTSVLSRRASQAGDGITGRGRRASQAQIMMTVSGDQALALVGDALDPSYNDVAGMKEALDNATEKGHGGNISVQILAAKYEEARGRGSDESDEEESLQNRIDDALDPSFNDRAAMRQLVDEADATYFQHPMVGILRAKLETAEAQQTPRSVEPGASLASMPDEDSEEDEDADEDDFNVDAELPAFDPKPVPTGGTQRRGSIVQFGGRRMSMSVGAELQATAARLRQAVATGDATQMQAALDAAAPAAMMDGPGAAEVQQLAMEIASRLNTDEDLRRSATLRRSHGVRAKVRRLWDLMVVESAAIMLEAETDAIAAGYKIGAEGGPGGIRSTHAAEGASSPLVGMKSGDHSANEGEVTKGGYKLLHMRVAKVLTAPHLYNYAEANDDAEAEWDADVARFLGTSHIMVWLDTIRTKFHTASKKAVMEYGFDTLFKQYDDDGNGELDMEEFTSAVRNDLQIGRDIMPDHELRKMFYAVDTDRGGTVDGKEFVEWLMAPTPEGNRMKDIKEQFRIAAEAKTETIGWQIIFDKYDDDGSGELDLEEFTKCVRNECGLDKETTTDEDVQELFGIVDTDQSGAIDAEELQTFLTTDLEAASMTFTPFLASMFELTALWVPTESEKQYSRFLDVMFQMICRPCNGHTQDEGRELEKVPVIEPRVVDSRGNLVPNFRLRPLDEVESMILGDGNLEGFDAQSIAGLEAAERARMKAEARREAWRQEQERKRAVAEEARRRRKEAKQDAKAPPKIMVDSLEMLMGFRWHDGFRWHEGMRPPEGTTGKKKSRKKKGTAGKKAVVQPIVLDAALDKTVAGPGGPERSNQPLRYDPATHTIRQTPRPVLPKLKDPAEVAHVSNPTVMMSRGNLEITDKKGVLRARQGGAARPTTTDATTVGDADAAVATGTQRLSPKQEGVASVGMLRSLQSPAETSTSQPLVKHARTTAMPGKQSVQGRAQCHPTSPRLDGWNTGDSEYHDEQPVSGPASTHGCGSTIPTPPRVPRHTSRGQRHTVHRSQQQYTLRAGTATTAAASPQATSINSAYRSCHPGTRSTVREVATPPGSSQRVPVHAVLARTGNRAWSPRQMSAGAISGAGFRGAGFSTPERLSPKKIGVAYIQTLSPSQRTAAHTNATFERTMRGELPHRAATTRERVRPVRHHGASSIMTARPATAGQVF